MSPLAKSFSNQLRYGLPSTSDQEKEIDRLLIKVQELLLIKIQELFFTGEKVRINELKDYAPTPMFPWKTSMCA
jgi:hypothetical protein